MSNKTSQSGTGNISFQELADSTVYITQNFGQPLEPREDPHALEAQNKSLQDLPPEEVYEAFIAEKLITIQEAHWEEMRRITELYQTPIKLIDGQEKLAIVTGMQRINMHRKQTLKYGVELISASIDAFIETYSVLDECPDQCQIEAFQQRLQCITESLINGFPSDYYLGPTSQIPSRLTVSRIIEGLTLELKAIPGKYWPRVKKFTNQAAIRKARGLPINKES